MAACESPARRRQSACVGASSLGADKDTGSCSRPSASNSARRASWANDPGAAVRAPAPVLHSTETHLLLRVELPAVGWDFLLKFRVKPGGAFAQVQDGVAQAQLREWQTNLSEAKVATIRAETAKAEMARLKESYLKEISQLRQQLSLKHLAETKGEEFVPDVVSHVPTQEPLPEQKAASAPDAQVLAALKEAHQAEVEKLTKQNMDLLYKLKTKNIQSTLQTELLSKRPEILKEFADAEAQTLPPPPPPPPAAVAVACQEIQTNETRMARTSPLRRRTLQGGLDPRGLSKIRRKVWSTAAAESPEDEDDEEDRLPSSMVSFTAQTGDVEVLPPTQDASLASSSPSRSVSFAKPSVGVSVGTQVDAELPSKPAVLRKPAAVRRATAPLQKATTFDDEELDSNTSEPGEALSARASLPHVRTIEGGARGSLNGKPMAAKSRVMSLPGQASEDEAPMISINSGDGCTALFARTISESSRPAKRIITRPHLATPGGSRPLSRCSARERPNSRLMTTC